MKSYNVKSNAKRFARGIAAKSEGYFEAIEPVEVSEGAREWFPAVKLRVESARSFITDDISATAKILLPDGSYFGDAEVVAAAMSEGDAGVYAVPAEDMAELTEEAPTKSAADIAAMAASLPPRQTSTPEEIQKRRAERRAAIEADKASGARDRLGRKVEPEKINKKKTILDLVGRENGATQEELETATGWQRHTLRGYIAGTLRKIVRKVGRDIECQRGKDKPTRYVMVTVKEGGA